MAPIRVRLLPAMALESYFASTDDEFMAPIITDWCHKLSKSPYLH